MSTSATTEDDRDSQFLKRLGWASLAPAWAVPSTRPPAISEPPGPVPRLAGGSLAVVTVCSSAHLPFARVAIEALERHHPEAEVVLVVTDLEPGEAAPPQVGRAAVLPGSVVVGHRFPFYALKYEEAEFCYVHKPFAVRWVLRQGLHERVVYLDCDILLFSPLTTLLAALETHDFVVTPHVVAPFHDSSRFDIRPTTGDLAASGMLNAGLFGLRRGSAAEAFLDQYVELVSAPGAYVWALGMQGEQNAFNWVLCFAEKVHVLRDTAYNVAYWNLHDRALRWRPTTDGEDRFTVDGAPLVAFHFSGYSPWAPQVLSRHNQRHSLYILPAADRLCAIFRDRLLAQGAEEGRQTPYRFGRFPSGIPIDDAWRKLLRDHETYFDTDVDPWTESGEHYWAHALLSPIPHTGSLLPALFQPMYDLRADLQAAFPLAHLHPERIAAWIAESGVDEQGCRRLYDRHRPAVPTHHGVSALRTALAESPNLIEGLVEPLATDRLAFVARLERAGLPDLAGDVKTCRLEHGDPSPIGIARRIWETRIDLRRAFPDPLGANATAFAAWLDSSGGREEYAPATTAGRFLRCAEGRSLARVFSYFARAWPLMERWPLGLVGEGRHELAPVLLRYQREGLEYDADDIAMYLWCMDLEPCCGIGLTCELPFNARRTPSSLHAAGRQALFADLVARDAGFAVALRRFEEARGTPARRAAESRLRGSEEARARPISVFAPTLRNPAESGPGWTNHGDGANLFGYFKSPHGMGRQTRGLAEVLRAAGLAVAENTLGCSLMAEDLTPADFVDRYDDRFDTNVFVSYPHLHERLLHTLHPARQYGRRNIVQLAWEQRDGSPRWAEVFADFDQVWAVSDFTASSLSTWLARPVITVPNTLDFASLPAPASKAEVGLDPDRFTVLYICDANSSLERKNPEGVVEAFRRAFADDEKVSLVLRISHVQAVGEYRERLRRLAQRIPPGLPVRLSTEPMTERDILRLISAADAYLSLHRAEGFGLTCAEAMALGVPVIATGYSGNLQFMRDDNSHLVRYDECEVKVPDGPFVRGSRWANPDLEHAAHLLRQVFLDPAVARRKAAVGRDSVRRELSAQAAAERVKGALEQGRATKGDAG